MNRDPEPLSDRGGQRRRTQPRVGLPQPLQMIEHLIGQLVAPRGPGLAGTNPASPSSASARAAE